MEDFIGKRIKITTPTNRVFYGKCIYILKDVHVGVLYDNGTETAFNTNDGVKVELVDLPQAPETTASPSETAADKGILTEEELKDISVRRILKPLGVNWEVVDEIINSHRLLLSANTELSFKNQKYKEALRDIIECDMPDYEEDFTEMKRIANLAMEELK